MASFLFIFNKSYTGNRDRVQHDSLESYDGDYSWTSETQDSFFADDRSGCSIVSDSRIDYKRELAGKLGINREIAEGFSDSRFILSAYLKWGEDCLSHLYGDFSFVIWNPGRDEIFCARDHFGCRPLYFADQPEFFVVASQISAFKSIPGFSIEIREQYIMDALCAVERNEATSAYRGISRLKPAHYLKITKGILSPQHRYWDLKINEDDKGLTFEEAASKLRERFFEAIRQRMHVNGSIGVELSGGLDSSGIASALALLSGPDVSIHAFTHAISSDGLTQHMSMKSEQEYSEAVVEKYRSVRQFKITGEQSAGSYTSMTEALNRLYKPVNLNYAVNSDVLFKEAGKQGTSIIFSGLGGDEGITYDGSGYFNELISHAQYARLGDQIQTIAGRRGSRFYRRFIHLLINYYTPPWMFNLIKKDWKKARYRSFAPQRSLARKHRVKKRFYSSHTIPAKADVRAIQYFRLTYPNIPERIEETSLLAGPYGIEYRYPFLDVKLVEFFYSLPSEYKYRKGMGRYLFRAAMKEILPENIRMRADKGGNTIPYAFDRVLKDEGVFRDIIGEGRLRNHYHYVDYNKLDQMLDSFKNMGALKQRDYGLREFQSAMSVLILQKWQREGKIDIGIRC